MKGLLWVTRDTLSVLLDHFHVQLYFYLKKKNYQFKHLFAMLTDCNGTFRAPLPSLAGKAVTCHISSSCAALQCCVKVPIISTTFTTKLEVDPCNFKMTVEIEQLKFTKNLFDYEWGLEEQVWLFGVVRTMYVHMSIIINI